MWKTNLLLIIISDFPLPATISLWLHETHSICRPLESNFRWSNAIKLAWLHHTILLHRWGWEHYSVQLKKELSAWLKMSKVTRSNCPLISNPLCSWERKKGKCAIPRKKYVLSFFSHALYEMHISISCIDYNQLWKFLSLKFDQMNNAKEITWMLFD